MGQICRNCEIEKDFSCFGKDKRLSLGYKYFCKSCFNLLYNDTRKIWKRQNKDKIKGQNSRYTKSHRAFLTFKESLRRSAKLKATPRWLSKEHHMEIERLYKEASAWNEHVDHIVPLQGKNVCGLHVPWNLQLLSGPENLSKGNRY